MELIVEDIACARGGLTVFEGLSFTVRAGEALLVSGPNGAGKTSLLRILAGFLPPQKGSVHMPVPSDISRAEKTGYLGHASGLKGALTVRENAQFWCRLLGGNAAVVDGVLERFSLRDLSEMPVAYLSAGQQRRLALARLLLAARPLWLLDEPTASLDESGRAVLVSEMSQHLSQGGMIVAASHVPLGIPITQTIELGGRRQGRADP